MKKKLILLTIFLICFDTEIFACNFKIKEFGTTPNEIQLSPPPLPFPDRFGGHKLLIPMEQICKEATNLYGTMVVYLYIDNKLVQIRLERVNLKDMALMDFSMKQYGKFDLPPNMEKKQFIGDNFWRKEKETIRYTSINIFQGHTEVIEIIPHQYEAVMRQYDEKIGLWLNSQK